MEILGHDLVANNGIKVAKKYYCYFCDYNCSKIYNWNKHLNTAKHKQQILGNNLISESGTQTSCKNMTKSSEM